MSEENNQEQNETISKKIAFIIDNTVVDVIQTDEKLAAIFLSDPTVKDITGEDGNQIAWLYDDYDSETESFSRDGAAPLVTEEPEGMPPIKIAFILNNKVVDILHTEERLAAIFLSDPTVKDVTGEDGNQTVQYGDVYNNETNLFEGPSEEHSRPLEHINFEGWIYNEELGHSVPPIPYPSDGGDYDWSNQSLNWVRI